MPNVDITKGASRSYKINDDWLDAYSNDQTRYCDVSEILNNPATSQYLADLVNMGLNIDYTQEQHKAAFYISGFKVNNGDNGHAVKRILAEEDPVIGNAYVSSYADMVVHPERVRRVYANETTARGIEILGNGTIHNVGAGL